MPTSDDPPPVTLRQLIFLHTVAVGEFGGAEGARDRGALESALARPLSRTSDARFFTTPFERASALMEALIRNRGFVDGNKRTAVLTAAFWLEREGYELVVTAGEIVDMTLAVAERRAGLEELAGWLEEHSRSRGG